MSSATVWKGCGTGLAVWGPAALKALSLTECQSSAVFLDESRWRGRSRQPGSWERAHSQRLLDQGGHLELDALLQLADHTASDNWIGESIHDSMKAEIAVKKIHIS